MFRYAFHQFEELPTHGLICDRIKAADEFNRLRASHQVARVAFIGAEGSFIHHGIGKEIRDGDTEDLGHISKARGTDAVGAPFVFLHLLKREPEPVSELLLVHPKQQTPYTDAAADVDIHGVCHAGSSAIGRGI